MTEGTKAKRPRKSAAERIGEMLDVADTIVNRERSAEIPMQEIADGVGTSRALVYAYFPDRNRLLDALLDRHVAELDEAGLLQAAGEGDIGTRACASARIYLEHLARKGAALEIVLRDEPIARELEGRASSFRSLLYMRLARAARRELHMNAREAVALVQLLAAIPVEAARQVHAGGLALDAAKALSDRLMLAALDAQVPNAMAGEG